MSKSKKNNKITSNDYDFTKLKLKARDLEDLNILSSLCQDGIFSYEEMIFLKQEKKFVATFSRFCWEFKNNFYYDDLTNFRIVSGLQINKIQEIKYLNFKKKKNLNYLNLLSITLEDGYLSLNFSLDLFIRMKVINLDVFLDDIDMPWPTINKPKHR